MKIYIALLCSIVVMFAIAGCGKSAPKGSDPDVKALVIKIVKEQIFTERLAPTAYQKVTGIPVNVIEMKVTYAGLKAKASSNKEAANAINLINKIMATLKFSLSNIHSIGINEQIKQAKFGALLNVNETTIPIEYTAQYTDDGQLYVKVSKLDFNSQKKIVKKTTAVEKRNAAILVKKKENEEVVAKKLLKKASSLMNSAMSSENYSEAFNLYKKAKTNINLILSKHPSSFVASDLKNIRIGIGHTSMPLYKFLGIEQKLNILSNADKGKGLFELAEFVRNDFQQGDDFWLKITDDYMNVGEKEQASHALSKYVLLIKKRLENYDVLKELLQIADRYIKMGEKTKAKEILLLAVKRMKIVTNNDKANPIMQDIANLCMKLNKTWANEILTQLTTQVSKIDYSHKEKAKMFKNIALNYFAIGQKEKADKLLTQAIKQAEEISWKGFRSYDSVGEIKFYAQLAASYFAIGQKEKADKLLTQALALDDLGKICWGKDKIKFYTQLAFDYFAIGQKEKADKLLTQALDDLNKIRWSDTYSDREDKIKFYTQLVLDYVAIGQKEKADKLLAQALDREKIRWGDTYGEREDKIKFYTQLALNYFAIGQKEKADKLLAQTLDALGKIRRKSEIRFYAQLAASYFAIGQKEKADKLLTQALNDLGEMRWGDTYSKYKVKFYSQLALDYFAIGQKEKADAFLVKLFKINCDLLRFRDERDGLTAQLAIKLWALGEKTTASKILSKIDDKQARDAIEKSKSSNAELSDMPVPHNKILRKLVKYIKTRQFNLVLKHIKRIPSMSYEYNNSTKSDIIKEIAVSNYKLKRPINDKEKVEISKIVNYIIPFYNFVNLYVMR